MSGEQCLVPAPQTMHGTWSGAWRWREEIDPEVQDEIDGWRRLEPDNPSRSTAIQCLILMGIRLAQDERKREITKQK